MVSVFNTTIKNIMANFIPHETIICDDRDPPWINNRIKQLIYKRNSFNIFKSRLLRFVRPLENSVFTCHNPMELSILQE